MNVYDGEGPTDPLHLPLEQIKFGQTRRRRTARARRARARTPS